MEQRAAGGQRALNARLLSLTQALPVPLIAVRARVTDAALLRSLTLH
jgi:hypothetical protein